ncbi:MAG: DUF4345 family protein [Pseudomonadota bacterium]
MGWETILALVACAIGGGMGLYGVIDPAWVGRLVHLSPTEGRKEGVSEFRATYGGLFFMGHAFAALSLGGAFIGASAAAAAIGAGWIGASIGRCISMIADGAATKTNAGGAVFEFLMGVALGAPLILAHF